MKEEIKKLVAAKGAETAAKSFGNKVESRIAAAAQGYSDAK